MANKSYAPPLGTSTPRATGAQREAMERFALLCLLLVGGLFVAVPTYMQSLPSELRQYLRLGIPVVLFVATLLTYTTVTLKPYRKVALSYLAVSLGLAVDRYVGNLPLNWLGWSANTPQGAAIGKIGECWPIILAILLFTWLGGEKLSCLYLQRGRLASSLALGLGIGAFCFVPFVLMGGLQATLNRDPFTILRWMPWLIAFSLANGFMEEFWFRGSWMSQYAELLGPRTGLYLTTLLFTLMHVIVYWSQPYSLLTLTVVWAVLAYACGWITQKTNTLWGAVLGHTLADILFMLGTFAAIA